MLLTLAIILAIVGVVGAIVPALPGPPISWVALLLAYLSKSSAEAANDAISSTILWVMLAVTVIVTVLDYFAPAMLTRLGGGSQAAGRGATIGTFVGLFLAPWGLLLGPFLGAFLGEWMAFNPQSQSVSNPPPRFAHCLRVAALSFVGFLLTTGLKLISCLYVFYLILRVLIAAIA